LFGFGEWLNDFKLGHAVKHDFGNRTIVRRGKTTVVETANNNRVKEKRTKPFMFLVNFVPNIGES
jgi:hypothetical protein